MPFAVADNLVSLDGHCSIEEAEGLYEVLCGIEEPVFDLSTAGHLHTAIVQLMLASCGRLRAVPADPVLAACFGDRRGP